MQTTLKKKAELVALLAVCFSVLAAGRQGGSPSLDVLTTSLPKGYLHRNYEARLQAQGGITPLNWELSEGSLPGGVTLSHDGVLSGVPTQTGEFHFTVTVRDSSSPAYEKRQQLSLTIVAPMLLQWGKYPKVTGSKLAGSILVSNQTEQDFDLTVVMLAVNGTGRATAIGYQHFPLKKGSPRDGDPLRRQLPDDSYQLNVDAVAEVAETDSIYRSRLAPKESFTVKVNP